MVLGHCMSLSLCCADIEAIGRGVEVRDWPGLWCMLGARVYVFLLPMLTSGDALQRLVDRRLHDGLHRIYISAEQ